MSNAIYERASETAKKVRKALKENFPGFKFSVRAKQYSGGSSLRICWNDGPTEEQVTNVASYFEGATFDGMQDLKEYRTYEYEGKNYSGADFIFYNRELSHEYKELLTVTGKLIFGIDWEEKPWQYNKVEEEMIKEKQTAI